MKIRKIGAAAAAIVLSFMIVATPVSAHHGRRSQTKYPVCTVEDCTKTWNHNHNGHTYCGGTATGSGCRSNHH